MPSLLIDCLATTEPLSRSFSDNWMLQSMLEFETALARAEARVGVIPQAAADAICAAARWDVFNAASIARDAFASGTPAIPFVRAFTEHVRATDAEAAKSVHWGATSQDVTDTAIVLALRRAAGILAEDHIALLAALQSLSDRHASSIMLGRTLMQPAPPITFGLKTAGWAAAAARNWTRLKAAFEESFIVQFGGASGTLAAVGDKGIAVGEALATELGLKMPDAAWHAHRDRLAAVMAACGVYTGTLGKIARDIAVLMQAEVAEAAEPGGGSSTMPHKRNPAGCAITLAAANRVPALVASFLTGMSQEHERGAGGLQAEWPVIASIVQSTGAALSTTSLVIQGLQVYPERMLANIEARNGVIFAEQVVMMIAGRTGRDAAHQMLAEATRRCVESKRHLKDVLKEMPEIAALLTPEQLASIGDPKQYLGVAEQMRQRLLKASREHKPD